MNRLNLRITPTLASTIGAFVVVTAALVLMVQTVTMEEIIRRMGGDLVDLGMDGAETAFIEQLHAVIVTGDYTANALDRNTIDPADSADIEAYLFGALAPMEQVSFISVVNSEGKGIEVDRGDADGRFEGGDIDIPKDLPQFATLLKQAEQDETPFWSDPIYLAERNHTYFVYVRPLRQKGKPSGAAFIGMSLHRMSDITWYISTDDITVFLMREGSTEIIAHPDLHEKYEDLSADTPLIGVSNAPDDFLAGFHDLRDEQSHLFDIAQDLDLMSGYTSDDEKRFLIVERKNEELKGLPVRIGVHFPAEFLDQPVHQLFVALAIATALLLMSLIGSVVLARRIALPIQRAATSAKDVARLNLGTVKPLPKSRIRELDDLATGFNAMVGGLAAFNRYVPTSLVKRLMTEGRTESPPEERDVAVLFTDIAGYTAVSEGMTASETAAFVNHHLSLIGAEITRQNGTIDKYIGDAVMAFWGAPETLDAPAVPAAKAAVAISAAVRADNLIRRQNGKPPVRIRVGIHVGPLVVGDIGAPERVNYTVIGDTVNVAARLESLGKEIDPSAEVIILASKEVEEGLPETFGRQEIGPHHVKGRTEPVEVIRLSE
ncbi:adenylate/guanylate cyclase domain-containing protein [Roseibium denhamense]|uniref:Adenylate cyclase, class 3 n=1 Tax=Roseibium denhamense TaxID=76305 RepID=A0ABY1N6C3_9HYPH|nr:adenylate/guanylate cyclase domain-containing protein [Roseibium denhamense]MTI06062.1 adenylate/guanylate cyclase domain-containing protein [Roseibium denhamense]SMP01560.1 Adenylate cyclase, class 3 [Roseibium denhamense]